MPMHHSEDDAALRRHQTFDLAAAMTAATDAATAAFEAAGMPLPQVVVNVSWSEDVTEGYQRSCKEFVAGSAAPACSSDFLAESLRASAEEVEAAAAARATE